MEKIACMLAENDIFDVFSFAMKFRIAEAIFALVLAIVTAFVQAFNDCQDKENGKDKYMEKIAYMLGESDIFDVFSFAMKFRIAEEIFALVLAIVTAFVQAFNDCQDKENGKEKNHGQQH